MGNYYKNSSAMVYTKKICLTLSMCLIVLANVFSQEFDENGDLIYNIYKLPSVEVSTGVLTFFGDVSAFNRNVPFIGKHNFGLGACINQRIGSFFGVSAGFQKGKLTGFDTRPGSYYNFQSDVMHLQFNISLHLDNDIIFDKSSRFAPYLTAGFGYLTFDPKGDLRDKDNKYYYYWRDGTIRDQEFDPENPQNGNLLVRDYTFETELDSLNKNANSALSIPVGGGVTFKLSDALEASIAMTYVFTNTNFVDNLAAENKSYPFFDRKNDNFLYSSVSIRFNIGSIQKQILQNKPYKNINFAEIDAMDSDGDGIKDYADKCPGTPKGVKIDVMGCPVDDDNDGVPNYLDKEMNTSPGSIVDDNGVTITPEMIEAKYIRDSLLMAGELIIEKKYSEGTPIITDDYGTGADGAVYSHVTFPYVAANWPEDVKSIPVRSSGSKSKTSSSGGTTKHHKTYETESGNVLYKVQIGASQKPLEPSFFTDRFGVNKDDISIEQADGWYRYTVGSFRSYKAAKEFAQTQSKVEGAFVVKYENGQRVIPTGVTTNEPGEYTTTPIKTTKTTPTPGDTKGVYFRVQIGSSASKLSPTFFKNNFGITDEIYEELVDGQYKYTTGYFKTYNEARKHSATITSVQGAFVTSYKDGKRIPLQDAINAVE